QDDNFGGRTVREYPRRQADGTHEGLVVPRGHTDDEPLCFTLGDARETFGEKFEIFIPAEAATFVQAREGLHREGEEFCPYQFFSFIIHVCYSLEELVVTAALPRCLVARRVNA